MKIKYFLITLLLLFLCGCENISHKSIEEILQPLDSNTVKTNMYRTGYKYYLPKQMQVTSYTDYNEIIEDDNYIYYLYTDMISYINKTKDTYEKNSNAYYSNKLSANNKTGYLEINLQENNQYLIEIMFNYAKIEVMVDSDDINLALNYCVSILKSITYNDNVISNILDEDILTFQEEIYDIFTIKTNNDNLLDQVDDEDEYIENELKDTDMIS